MNMLRFTLKAVGTFLFFVTFPITMQAATYVASGGSDAGACPRTAPCRTVNYALTQTVAGGTVVVLDSGVYQPFSINKSVSIVAEPGGYSQINVAGGGSGVTVNALSSDTVVLRGLALKGSPSSTNGIDAVSGATLEVENCVISGFGSSGIYYSGSTGSLLVRDTTVSKCLNGISIDGIGANGAGGRFDPSLNLPATIEHCLVENNSYGILAKDNVNVTVRDSVVTHNIKGFTAIGSSEFTVAFLAIGNCVATNNDVGIYGFGATGNNGGASILLSNSTVTGNKKGLVADQGSVIRTRQNNTVELNGTDTAGFISTYTAK
jgi:Right handed beta helix region